MDENNPVNQESFDKQKLAQLENELKNIGKNVSPEISPQPGQLVQKPSTSQTIQTTAPEESISKGLKKSKGILWIGIVLLILALVGVGAYYLGFRSNTSRPSITTP